MFKKLLILATASTLFTFSSCKKSDNLDQVSPSSTLEEQKEIHVCTEINSDDNKGQNSRTDAAIVISNKWVNGTTIRVKFLNGDAFLQSKVMKYANEWTLYANLKFQFVGINDNADIKIGFKFNNDGGSWSYIGTDCKGIAQNTPSMNFGWFTASTPEAEFNRTISHEFGHALGLIHEHSSPAANIQWNKPVVYAYYTGAPNYWTTAQVDNNLFNKYSTTQTNYTGFDAASIMTYAIPSSFTTNGYSVPSNNTLSWTDKVFISQQYPFPRLSDRLYLGQALTTNQFLQSPDGRFKLIMQGDGNLVLYKNGSQAIWATNTWGHPEINRCDMQLDGNFVVYSPGKAWWSSNTWGAGSGALLILQSDGNLVMYKNNVAIWSSNTWRFR